MKTFFNLDFKTLTDSERAIYQYIISNTSKIPYMRIRDIADEAHTSTASVIRFTNKLGFKSFPEFKLALKDDLSSKDESDNSSLIPYFNLLDRKIFNQDFDYQINNVSKKIIDCDTINFVGIGASGSIAEYGARKLAILGYNSSSFCDPNFPIASRLLPNGQNIVIILSISGNTIELTELITKLDHQSNVYFICITGNKSGQLAKVCDYIIDYEVLNERKNNRHYDLSSQVPCVVILESLINAIRNKQS